MSIKPIVTNLAPAAIGPYSQAVRVGSLIFTSGQIPLTAEGVLIKGGIEEQTHQVILNVRSILQAGDSDLSRIVKVTLFIKEMDHFQQVNEVYQSYFSDHRPARSCVEVARLPKDVLIEMEVIAEWG